MDYLKSNMDYLEYLKKNVKIEDLGVDDSNINRAKSEQMGHKIAKAMNEWWFYLDDNSVMAYNGKVYERLYTNKLWGAIGSVLNDIGVGSVYSVYVNRTILNIVKNELRGRNFNVDRRYVSFNNGLVNIESMTLEPHNPNIHTECYFDMDFHVGIKYSNIIGWADRFTGYSVKTYMDRCWYKADGNKYEYIPYRKLYNDYKKYYDDIEVMRLDAGMFRKFLGIFGFERIGGGNNIKIKVYK